MIANQTPVTLSGTIEGAMHREDAPEAMHAYVVLLADGQRIQTNARNLKTLAIVPEEVAPDLVPTEFHARHEAEAALQAIVDAVLPKTEKPARKSRPPHNARLPREGGMA